MLVAAEEDSLILSPTALVALADREAVVVVKVNQALLEQLEKVMLVVTEHMLITRWIWVVAVAVVLLLVEMLRHLAIQGLRELVEQELQIPFRVVQ